MQTFITLKESFKDFSKALHCISKRTDCNVFPSVPCLQQKKKKKTVTEDADVTFHSFILLAHSSWTNTANVKGLGLCGNEKLRISDLHWR
jgi:hypothetical protein